MAATPPPVEPGYTTTEFWVALATAILGIAVAFGLPLTDAKSKSISALILVVAPVVAYILARGIRKAGS